MVSKNHGGRPLKYLTVECWERWKNNDYRHLNWKVNFMLTVLLATFGASIARLFMG